MHVGRVLIFKDGIARAVQITLNVFFDERFC